MPEEPLNLLTINEFIRLIVLIFDYRNPDRN